MINVVLANQLGKIPLPGTPYTLMGVSDESHVGFFIPELRWKFDAGVPTDSQDDFTFLTCTKRSHICELPTDFLVTKKKPVPPPKSGVHAKGKPRERPIPSVFTHYPKKVLDFVSASLTLTKNSKTVVMPIWQLVNVVPNVPMIVMVNKTKFNVIPIVSAPTSIGYGFTEIRQKLKPEYLSLPQLEINKLSKDGVEICAEHEYHHFCYFGDVDFTVLFGTIGDLAKYRMIIVPAPPADVWAQFHDFIMEHPEITFVLHGIHDNPSIPKNVMRIVNSYGSMGIRTFFDTSVQTIQLCPGFTLSGASEAARHTGFFVPELGICLDAGVPTDNISEHVFISHGHWDHVRNLPCLVRDSPTKLNVYIPGVFTDSITNFIQHSLGHELNWNLVSMNYTDCKMITVINRTTSEKIVLKIEPFKCTHSCPCIGYGFIKLDLETDTDVPLFCFLGDTDHKVMSNEYAKLIKYQTIIVECTFFEPENKKDAKKDKHMYWDNLIPFIRSHPEIKFILYHFSCRYKPQEIITFFTKCGFSNVVPFVNTYKSKKLSASSSEDSPCGAGFGAGAEDE